MTQELDGLNAHLKNLSAKHAALDQMFADSIRSNHDLRTMLVLKDNTINELAQKLSECEAKLKTLENDKAVAEAAPLAA